MRKIKFRMWDGNNRHFVYPELIELNSGLEYQQYTGLKDRHGVEIYAGDIIKGKDHYEGLHILGIVGFRDGSFCIKNPVITHYRWIDYDIEVIGNVHDNPTLFEEEWVND